MAQLQSTSITGSLIVTGGITGSFSGSIVAPGSTTQVLYNNSGVISANSGFVYSSGNVGIGTSSPSTKLQVNSSYTYGTINDQLTLNGSVSGGTSTNPAYYGGITITGEGYEWGAIRAIQTNPAASWTSRLAFYTLDGNGGQPAVERMSIDNGGKVGIGTSNPSARLHISAGDNSYSLFGPNSTWSSYLYVGAGPNIISNAIAQVITTNGNLHLDSGANQQTYINFYSQQNTYINPQGGNVGINTVNPTYKLTVDGNVSFESGKLFTVSNGSGQSLDIWHSAGSGANAWRHIYGGSGTGFGVGVGGYGIYYGGNSNYSQINYPSGNVFFPYNVGIGISSPLSKLQISSGDNADTQLIIGEGASYGAPSIRFKTAATNYMGLGFITGSAVGDEVLDAIAIQRTGNVGVGTTSPPTKLTVTRGAQSDTVTPANAAAYLYGSDVGLIIGQFASGPYGTWLQSIRPDNVTFPLSLQPAGSGVGINTSNPRYQLDLAKVNDASQVDYIALGVNNGPSGGGGSSLGSGIIWKANYVTYTKRSAGIVQIAESNYFQSGLAFYTNGTADETTDWSERMRITKDGNVGIGTTSPSAKLDVNGGDGTPAGEQFAAVIKGHSGGSRTLYFDGVSNASVWWGSGNSPQFAIDSISGGGATFWTNDGSWSERMRIDSSGNVMLGTTTPLLTATGRNTLTLNGTSTSIITLSNGGTWKSYFYNDGSNTFIGAAGEFSVYTNSAATLGMFINTSGNVGFGTTSPTQKLHVAGNLRVTGAIYDSNNSAGSSGEILTSTGTGTDWVSLSSISGVDGTGTANYVPKWTDTDTIGNSIIYETSSNIGIGTTSPGAKLEVNGSFRATTKSFIIDHPTKENKKLQYGVLEGPEHSVYVRGKLTNTNVIQLPDYWYALIHEDSITVNLTAIGKKQDLWVEEITDTHITVASETGDINCFYAVFAERKDVEKLVTEFDKE